MASDRPTRLLISARDPGAAGHMREIATRALRRGDFEVLLAAQSPAREMLAAAGLPVENFPDVAVSGPSDPRAAELVDAADALLARFSPDTVLTGLSGPDAGIDEALLLRAQTPYTFAMQDYWGDVNLTLGKPASCYLVLDEEAVAISRARFGVRAVAVGSPKHAAYRDLDAMRLRAETRRGLGLAEAATLVGWFGQPLWRHDEYIDTLDLFGRAVSGQPVALLYHPHPKETPEQRARAVELLGVAGRRVLSLPIASFEACLCACEWVCSVFSTCGLDAAMLASSEPDLPVRSLYFIPPFMSSVHESYTGLDGVPLARSGLACEAHSEKDLVEAFSRGQARINGRLPDPKAAADRILALVADAVRF